MRMLCIPRMLLVCLKRSTLVIFIRVFIRARFVCMRSFLLVGLLVGLLIGWMPFSAHAASPTASTPLRGVVWTPPDQARPAILQLQRMHDMGVTAVRLTRLLPDAALSTADTLGVRLFVDLPAAYHTASRLRARLPVLQEQIRRIAAASRSHPSLSAIGLAQNADTRHPATCDVIETLHRTVRQQSNDRLRTYYVTAFAPATDACTSIPNRILVDLRGVSHLNAHWEAWQDVAPAVGIGAVGTWVDPKAAVGLRVPFSAERHARFFEHWLPLLFDTAPVLFAYRWRDAEETEIRRYGLHTREGPPRPALEVVRGLYSGTQTTFAYPTGRATNEAPVDRLLLGWGLLAMLVLLYAQRSEVRRMVQRYIRAPAFYREGLREGRDTLPAFSTLLLLQAFITLALFIRIGGGLLHGLPAVTLVLEAMPPVLAKALGGWVEHPLAAGGLVVAPLLGASALWCGLLLGVAQHYGRFSIGQTLMLIAWPCWPAILGLLVALALPGDASPPVTLVSLALGAGTALPFLLLRILRDYASVTAVPFPLVLVMGALSPLGILVAAATGLGLATDVSFALLVALVRP